MSEVTIGQSAQALYINALEKARRGYAVDSGCAVSINSGELGTSDALSVAAGDIWFGGGPVSVSSQNVRIEFADSEPRRDVVYLDGGGNAQVAKGISKSTPEVQDEGGATRFEYVEPEPPDLANTDAVILAEVWVPAGATAISSSDVADRRVDPTDLPYLDFSTTDNLLSVNGIVSADDPTDTGHLTTKSYVDSVAQGLEYKESVLDEQNDPPSSPGTGDRYLIDDSPSGDWSGHPNELTEWDGSAWTFTVPNEGWSVWVEDIDVKKAFNGTDWVRVATTLQHSLLQNLSNDDHPQYLLVDGTRAMSGALPMGGNDITNAGTVNATTTDTDTLEYNDAHEPVGSAVDQGSGVYDLDLTSANLFAHTLTEATEFSFSNASSSPAGNSFTLKVTQDGSTQYGITWPASVEWNGGSAPSDPAVGKELEVSFISYDGGSTWKGRKSWGT